MDSPLPLPFLMKWPFGTSEGICPDHEVLTALRPATSTIPGAKIIAISTPYAQAGSLYEAHREHYGQR